MRYLPQNEADRMAMLAKIGVSSIDDLYVDVPAAARLDVVDVSGRHLRTLLAGELPAGEHVARWDGRDDAGRALGAGVYLVRLDAGGTREARSLVLLR